MEVSQDWYIQPPASVGLFACPKNNERATFPVRMALYDGCPSNSSSALIYNHTSFDPPAYGHDGRHDEPGCAMMKLHVYDLGVDAPFVDFGEVKGPPVSAVAAFSRAGALSIHGCLRRTL